MGLCRRQQFCYKDFMIVARLRQWARPVLAGLLLLGLLIPTLDAFKCIDDLTPKGAIGNFVQVTKALTTQEHPDQPVTDQDDVDPLCPHGHCHHWLGLARLSDRLDFRLSAKIMEPVRGAYERPPSAPRTELLRPPRA